MYHFIGIKGSGMSSLAVILKQLGYEVNGSDVSTHFFTEEELIKNKIEFTEYNSQNIKENQIIIVGASIKTDNPELIRAKELQLKIYNYNEMVGELTKLFKTICICGCHGKTTTTSMLGKSLNEIVGSNYLIGDGTGYAAKDNKYFVLESCEYQRHFLKYNPYYTVILNIDLDHVDYYKDINDIIDAYNTFANKSQKMIIAYGEDVNIQKLIPIKEIKYFGFADSDDIIAKDIIYNQNGIEFSVYNKEKFLKTFNLPIFGKHQLIDALAVISVCYYEEIDLNILSNILKNFKGAKRRFTETIAGDSIIIDDYAHHPNEIKATLDAVKQKYPDKKIISIFEPHTFSRTKEFYKDIAKILKETTAAYLLDIHPAREKQEDFPDITKEIIIKEMPNGYPITEDEANILSKYDNSVFVFMSPNDISKLENDLINLKRALQKK